GNGNAQLLGTVVNLNASSNNMNYITNGIIPSENWSQQLKDLQKARNPLPELPKSVKVPKLQLELQKATLPSSEASTSIKNAYKGKKSKASKPFRGLLSSYACL